MLTLAYQSHWFSFNLSSLPAVLNHFKVERQVQLVHLITFITIIYRGEKENALVRIQLYLFGVVDNFTQNAGLGFPHDGGDDIF